MKYYKELLLNKLTLSGWELLQTDTTTSWWLESYWKVKSIKQNYGYELFILFLIDPLYDQRSKDSVYAIEACRQLPVDRPTDNQTMTMYMIKGKFDERLSEFVEAVNQHRNHFDSRS